MKLKVLVSALGLISLFASVDCMAENIVIADSGFWQPARMAHGEFTEPVPVSREVVVPADGVDGSDGVSQVHCNCLVGRDHNTGNTVEIGGVTYQVWMVCEAVTACDDFPIDPATVGLIGNYVLDYRVR